MNIGIDIRPLMTKNRTGVGEYTFELLNALFKIDQTNKYWLFYNSYHDIEANIPRWTQANVRYLHTRWPNKLFNAAQKFLNYPKLDKIFPEKLDYFLSFNLNFTSLSLNTKFILTIHDLSFIFFPEYFSPKQRIWHRIISPEKQCRRADIILAPSKNTKRDLIKFFHLPTEKIKVIYPGLSSLFSASITQDRLTAVKKKYNLPDNFILFLGTIEPRKNVLGIIKSFEKATHHLPADCAIVIAGDSGYQADKIKKYVDESLYKNRIKFLNYIEPTDKPPLYTLAKKFIFPSFYEGFGFPVLEAMATNTPVITSAKSSLPEITGDSAILINPNYPKKIAEAILKNFPNKNLTKKNGPDRATQFSWEESARNLLQLLV